jgi:thymidylate synthase (FAD)
MSSSVSLVWITPDAETKIAKMARVSNPDNQNAPPDRLIAYCIRKRHWSIFEMCNMCLDIHTRRDVSAQFARHSSIRIQEFSQRYAQVSEKIDLPDLRLQDAKNRQASNPWDDVEAKSLAQEKIAELFAKQTEVYESLLAQGVAKECARSVLPMCSPTHIYANGNIRSWIHYIEARASKDAQGEHELLAMQVKELFVKHFPITAKALEWTK